MQIDNTDNRDKTLQEAESIKNAIERDLANHAATKLALENNHLANQRDRAIDLAATEIEQRTQAEQNASVAVTAASIEANQRILAEQEAARAQIAAQQARQEASRLATERSLLRENLASEREASSNASFGFVFLTCIVLAALIGLGIWVYTSNSSASTAGGSNGTNSVSPTSSTSMNGQAASGMAKKETPTTVIVRENPSLVVVPVASTSNEAKRAQEKQRQEQKAEAEAKEAAETLPPPDTSDTSEADNSDATQPDSQNSSGSEGTKKENTNGASDG